MRTLPSTGTQHLTGYIGSSETGSKPPVSCTYVLIADLKWKLTTNRVEWRFGTTSNQRSAELNKTRIVYETQRGRRKTRR